MQSIEQLTKSFNSFCDNCKQDQIYHDQKQGILTCRICNIVSDNHYISTENEVRNFGDDKENEKLSRVENDYYHPLFGTDDTIATKIKQKKPQEPQIIKNWRQVESQLKHMLRKFPRIISVKIFKKFYEKCLQKKKNYDQLMEQYTADNSIKKPTYGIQEVREDAAIAVIDETFEYSKEVNKLLTKIASKLKVDLDKLKNNYKEQYQQISTFKKEVETPLSVAKQKAEEYLSFDKNLLDVLEQTYNNIQEYVLGDSEHTYTKAGALLYLICSNCIDYKYNQYTMKDIASFVDKEESTIKKLYQKFMSCSITTKLPNWIGRK